MGCVKGNQGARYLESRSIAFVAYPDAAKLVEGLSKGEVDAVVEEAPILKYHVNKSYQWKVVVLPGTFENHGYGFGLPIGSPLRRRIDISLLRIIEGSEWNTILTRYLGKSGD